MVALSSCSRSLRMHNNKVLGLAQILAGIMSFVLGVVIISSLQHGSPTKVVALGIVTLIMSVLFAVSGVARLKQARRAIWKAEGRCAVCGYDIRGIDSACPECGTPILR